MKIPLGKPYIKKEIVLKEIEKVLDRKWISGGPAIGEFEDAIKSYNNDKDGYYIAVANATVGLELALLKINNGKRYSISDEIIVPSWSWVASGFVIKNVGATPVWVDVNKFGVPEPDHINRLITPKTVAILIVHQMGIPCDIDKINKASITNYGYKLPIIEDAACAFGSEYNGKKIGVSENEVVYSFQARKCLTTAEGGMIITRNLYNAEWYRSMRVFGTNVSPLKRDIANYLLKEKFTRIGTNYKISDIQCALGLAHLQYFDEEIALRTKAAEFYNEQVNEMKKHGYDVKTANIIPSYCTRYNWQNYHILLDSNYDRDKIIDELRKRDIGCKWDIQAIHLEPAIEDTNVILYNTEEFHNHGLCLPFFAEITQEEQQYVINNLKEILNNQ